MTRDDDIDPLLDELQETLTALRTELDDGGDDGRASRRRPRASSPPRPPRPGEFLRFTEEYTIPTVVSLLEATIQSLELLAGLIRLLDPDRSRSAADSVGRRATKEATRGATAALSELRRALSEVDLPPEGEARDIVADARELSAELERRIEAGETRTHDDSPVSIDVRESSDQETGEETDPHVDVESELDSIRESVRKERDDGANGNGEA